MKTTDAPKYQLFNLKTVASVCALLKQKQLTIACAESVTSGFLQAAFSAADDTTLVFQGGITAYNIGQKAQHLHVNPIAAETTNCVSETVAREMALGAAAMFSSEVAIGITGYAAKIPEKGISSLFAWYAIVKEGTVAECRQLKSSKADAVDVQLDYTAKVIDRLHALLISETSPKK